MEHREIKGENMEMRLIDANMMAVEESEAYISAQTSGKINPITKEVNSVVHRKIQQLIADAPTVDPETLPIVQKLREALARVAEAETRAEKAEKAIAAIKNARDKTRLAYIVDQILSEFYRNREGRA